MDPYQFRLQNIATQASDQANGLTALTWDRWKNVLMRAAKLANWQPRVASSAKQTGQRRHRPRHRARQLRQHAWSATSPTSR